MIPYDPARSEAALALRTYFNYAKAYAILLPDTKALSLAQLVLPGFGRLKLRPGLDVAGPLMRGCLTLKTMRALPVDSHPELAASANFWLPVQAYYAVHGYGLATLAAIGCPPPGDHRRFRASAAASLVRGLFPDPLRSACLGPVHETGKGTLEHCASLTVAEAADTNNLITASKTSAPRLVAKALHTTRRRHLEELLAKKRDAKKPGKNRTRSNLTSTERAAVSSGLHPTTVIDFLYRFRARSNYDDPEMFVYGYDDLAVAVDHYKSLLQLTEGVCFCLGEIVRVALGNADYKKLVERADH